MTKKFLKFRYTAIRRYGEKNWTACDGVVEFSPNYIVSVSTCEKEGLGSTTDCPYIVELSNGTKFLAFMRGYGRPQVEAILSEEGEEANIMSDQQTNFKRVKQMIHKLNNY